MAIFNSYVKLPEGIPGCSNPLWDLFGPWIPLQEPGLLSASAAVLVSMEMELLREL
jgi:hypothetical protein